ncbi:MAG: ABC transporter substrate-binding protein [Exilispira sp.]|jgi:branched-chain amino acid transport system substrate-binding protein|nr:ABC transporter substrate-binding protein [Exilispira sp.]
MKKIYLAILILLAVTIVFSQANPGDTNGITATEIKIGSFQALSGPVAAIGVPVKKGLDAYFNWVNANGGVFGRKINLIVADDAFNPSNTVVEVKRLVESDKVFALVCGLGAPGNLAIMDYVEAQKVPYVYQAAGAGILTIPPKRYIFGVQPNYTTEGAIAAKYLIEQKKAKRIAIVYRNTDDGKEELASVKNTIAKKGMSLAAEIPIEPTATDFSSNIVKLTEANADAVIVMLFVPQSSNFVKQAKQFGLTKQNYLLTYSNADPTFAAIAGATVANGVEALAWVNVDFTDPNAHFIKVYQATFAGEIPNAYAVAGMIAAEIFTEALNRAGKNLTREKLISALESMDKWIGKISPMITYGPINVKGNKARLGVQTMYILRFKEDGTLEKAFDWITMD